MKRKIIKGRIIGAESIIFKEKKRKKIKGRIRGVQNILYSPSPFIPTGIQLFYIAQIISGYMNWQPDPNSFPSIYTLAEGSSLPSGNRSKKTLLNVPSPKGFVDNILLELNDFHPPIPIICIADATRLLDEDNSGRWGWISYQDGPQLEILYYSAYNKWLANAFAHYPYSTTLDVNTSYITKGFSARPVSSDTNQFIYFQYKIGVGYSTQNANPPWVNQSHPLTIFGRPPNWANYYIITLEGGQVQYNNWISHNSNFTVNVSGNLGTLTHRSFSATTLSKSLQITAQYRDNSNNIIREVIKNEIIKWEVHSKILGWSTVSQVGNVEPATGYQQWWSSYSPNPPPTIGYDPNTTYHSSRIEPQSQNDIAVLVNDVNMDFSTSSPNTFTLHGIKRDGRFAIEIWDISTPGENPNPIFPPYVIAEGKISGKGDINAPGLSGSYPRFYEPRNVVYTLDRTFFVNDEFPDFIAPFRSNWWIASDLTQTIQYTILFDRYSNKFIRVTARDPGGVYYIPLSLVHFIAKWTVPAANNHVISLVFRGKKFDWSWAHTSPPTFPLNFYEKVEGNVDKEHFGFIMVDKDGTAYDILLIDIHYDENPVKANFKRDDSIAGKKLIAIIQGWDDAAVLVFDDHIRVIKHNTYNLWQLQSFTTPPTSLINLQYTLTPSNEYVFNYSKLNNVKNYYHLDGSTTDLILIGNERSRLTDKVQGYGLRKNTSSNYLIDGPLFYFEAYNISGQTSPYQSSIWVPYLLPYTDVNASSKTISINTWVETNASFNSYGNIRPEFHSNAILKNYPSFQ